MNTRSWPVQKTLLLLPTGIIIIIAMLINLERYTCKLLVLISVCVCCRLDRQTSGLLLFTRNQRAAARLSNSFMKRSVRKEYLARVKVRVLW